MGRQIPDITRLRSVPQLLFSGLLALASLSSHSLGEELTPDQAFTRFVERNPAVLAEREKLEVVRARLRQAGMLPNPTLVYGQEGLRVGEPNQSFFRDQEFIIGARQRLELGGKRGKRLKLARLELEAEGARYQNFLRLRRMEVGRLFAATYFAQKQRALLKESLGAYEKLREVHQERLEEGEVSALAQMKIDAEHLGYLAKLAVADRDLVALWKELSALIVWEHQELPTFAVKSVPSSTTLNADDLTQRAIESRPDLLHQRLVQQVSDASLQLEKAESVPDLTVGAGYKSDFGFNSFFLGLELPLPIFDRREGAVAEKAAEVRREMNLGSWKEMTVRVEVKRAFETFETLQRACENLSPELFKNLTRIIAVTELSYEEGEATILEYLDVLRTQRDAAVNYSRLLQELQLAFLELEAATGTPLRGGNP
jgi:cobalt-zinc-cadmium efflux system outer membrane protein